MEYNFCIYIVRQKISNSTYMSACIFLHQLLPFQRYKNFKTLTFKKQFKVTECKFGNYTIPQQMSKSTNVFAKFVHQLLPFQRYKKILNFLSPKSRSRSQSAIFASILFDGKCQNLELSPTNFLDNSYHFRDIKIFKMLP